MLNRSQGSRQTRTRRITREMSKKMVSLHLRSVLDPVTGQVRQRPLSLYWARWVVLSTSRTAAITCIRSVAFHGIHHLQPPSIAGMDLELDSMMQNMHMSARRDSTEGSGVSASWSHWGNACDAPPPEYADNC